MVLHSKQQFSFANWLDRIWWRPCSLVCTWVMCSVGPVRHCLAQMVWTCNIESLAHLEKDSLARVCSVWCDKVNGSIQHYEGMPPHDIMSERLYSALWENISTQHYELRCARIFSHYELCGLLVMSDIVEHGWSQHTTFGHWLILRRTTQLGCAYFGVTKWMAPLNITRECLRSTLWARLCSNIFLLWVICSVGLVGHCWARMVRTYNIGSLAHLEKDNLARVCLAWFDRKNGSTQHYEGMLPLSIMSERLCSALWENIFTRHYERLSRHLHACMVCLLACICSKIATFLTKQHPENYTPMFYNIIKYIYVYIYTYIELY